MGLRSLGELPVWAAHGSGYGSGYGYGYGYGYGSGYGYGYGSGYGDGYGYGYGYGSGYGSGYAGYGYGSGYGSGDSVEGERYCAALASDLVLPPDSVLGFWRSGKDGVPANGGTGEAAHEGMTQEVVGPLRLCKNALHATLSPEKWKGERWWIVALHNPVEHDSDKMRSLKRTILKDLGPCPFP